MFDGTVSWSEPTNLSDHFTVAIFRDGTSGALAAASDSAQNPNGRCSYDGTYAHVCTQPIRFVMQAGSTATATFRLRAGLNGGNVFINQGFNGAKLGGTLYSTFSVTEIAQ